LDDVHFLEFLEVCLLFVDLILGDSNHVTLVRGEGLVLGQLLGEEGSDGILGCGAEK